MHINELVQWHNSVMWNKCVIRCHHFLFLHYSYDNWECSLSEMYFFVWVIALGYTIETVDIMDTKAGENLCVALIFPAHIPPVHSSGATLDFLKWPFLLPFLDVNGRQSLHWGETIMSCHLWVIGPEVALQFLWSFISLIFLCVGMKWILK